MRSVLLSLLILLGGYAAAAAEPVLLPQPREVKWTGWKFPLNAVELKEVQACREELSDWLKEEGCDVREAASRCVEIVLVDSLPGVHLNAGEAYRLSVDGVRIRIEAVTDRGAYWAIQTLRQMVEQAGSRKYVAGCEITDWPAFRVRGFMHDVGRGYLPLAELKHQIAKLARYKINVFHWHLTEDLAWRLESRVFPMLNDSVNFGRYPGKYYTLEEAKELAAFCKAHRVMLIPEVDMPGHSAAFRKTFRHDMQSKEGMAILKLLIDEVCETFEEVPYLHIGTDEVQFTNPRFVPEMVAYVRGKGKKVISWNPGWKYRPGEVDMLQMWSYRGKPHKGIPVIDCRLHYLNHFDAFADLVGLFKSTVGGVQEGSPDFAGVILAIWNDRKVEPERNIMLENGFYPAMLTIAERSWRGGGDGYFYELGTLLDESHRERFAEFEKRLLWHKARHFGQEPFAYVRQSGVKWRITDAFPNGGDLKKVFPPEQETDTAYEYEGKHYGSRLAEGAAVYLRHVWGTSMPSFYSDPRPDHTAYAYTWVYSPCGQKVGAWLGTQNYGRSEKDLPPPAGKWDYRESRLWINGEEIAPPHWTASHRVKDNETVLGNENFETRPPVEVALKKGWNKVMWKLPVGKFTTEEVRLVKWMFTTVFVTPDGRKAVGNLIYDPDRKIKL